MKKVILSLFWSTLHSKRECRQEERKSVTITVQKHIRTIAVQKQWKGNQMNWQVRVATLQLCASAHLSRCSKHPCLSKEQGPKSMMDYISHVQPVWKIYTISTLEICASKISHPFSSWRNLKYGHNSPFCSWLMLLNNTQRSIAAVWQIDILDLKCTLFTV